MGRFSNCPVAAPGKFTQIHDTQDIDAGRADDMELLRHDSAQIAGGLHGDLISAGEKRGDCSHNAGKFSESP